MAFEICDFCGYGPAKRHGEHLVCADCGERWPDLVAPQIRPLTERQFEVFRQFGSELGWLRPMDLGARSGSNHSGVLAALERRGLVESRQRRGGVPGSRGSKVYRITTRGRAELSRARSTSAGSRAASPSPRNEGADR